jgi:hypothetical protein
VTSDFSVQNIPFVLRCKYATSDKRGREIKLTQYIRSYPLSSHTFHPFETLPRIRVRLDFSKRSKSDKILEFKEEKVNMAIVKYAQSRDDNLN